MESPNRAKLGPAITVAPRHLNRLKWVTTIVPAIAVFGYETVRHGMFDSLLPDAWGNLIAGLVALVAAYVFSELVFRIVERLQDREVEQSREMAELGAIVSERERLSRELHDGLAQLVAYLMVRIDTVETLVADQRLSDATEELERLRRSADNLYVDIRESISGLRAQVVEHGLARALRDYTQQFRERQEIQVTVSCGAIADICSPLVQLQLFRIIQEALANVRRHARARHVWVTIDAAADGREVRATIEDDGSGFDPDHASQRPGASIGLATMRERAEMLGGRLHIESQPGEHTRVIVATPLRAVSAEKERRHASPARR